MSDVNYTEDYMHKIGIYPGTFDPLHDGHLTFALAASEQCQLEKVFFLPEAYPRHKQHVTLLAKRIEQLRRALVPYSPLEVLELTSSPFTVTATLPELRIQFPEAYFTFLLGSDVALTLYQWPGVKELLEDNEVAIGMRSAQTEDVVRHSMQQLEASCHKPVRYSIIHTDKAHLASSHFR